MTVPSHILLGAIIGKATGNIPLAVAVSVAVDFDHFVSYTNEGLLKTPQKFWTALTSPSHVRDDQRTYFHNILVAGIVSGISFLCSFQVGTIVTLSYGGHLLLDMLDRADYWPLYPSKKINMRGFIVYNSWVEIGFQCVLALTLVLLFVFL